MDSNVVRTLNAGPMGPQGPVKVNNCIMNKEAGFEPVVRIYPHTWPENETTEDEEDTITGGAGGGDASIPGGQSGETTEPITDPTVDPTPTDNPTEESTDPEDPTSGDNPSAEVPE